MLESILGGFISNLSLPNLLAIVAGTAVGIIMGAFPGLDCTVSAALFIPVTYALDPNQAILLLVGMYGGAVYGGQIPAILFRIPGAPEAVVTTLDGYPMAQKGQAGRALGFGLTYSLIGNVFGGIVLLFLAPTLATMALEFGPAEYFALGVLGMTAIAGLGGKSPIKSLMSGLFGLLLATVGMDPITGVDRFTFGRLELANGIGFIPAVIGLFALAEVLNQVLKQGLTGRQAEAAITREEMRKLRIVLPTWDEIKRFKWIAAANAAIGAWIGVLPGVGATTAAIVGYSQTVRFSKNPENFGKGDPRGIVASETSNNAAVGGAMVPLLALGIPGSATTAVMLGAFMIHGLKPGPLLMLEQKALAYSSMAAVIVSAFAFFALAFVMVRPFIRLLGLPYPVVAAIIVTFCAVGALSMGDIFGLYLAFGFAVLSFLMDKAGFPTAPIVLGIVLGPIMESSFRRAAIVYGGVAGVFTQPIALGLLLLSVVSLLAPSMASMMKKRREAGCRARDLSATGCK